MKEIKNFLYALFGLYMLQLAIAFYYGLTPLGLEVVIFLITVIITIFGIILNMQAGLSALSQKVEDMDSRMATGLQKVDKVEAMLRVIANNLSAKVRKEIQDLD